MRKICFVLLALILSAASASAALYLRGNINDWGTTAMEENNGSYTLSLPELFGEFKIADANWATSYGIGTGADGKLTTSPADFTLVNDQGSANIAIPEDLIFKNVSLTFTPADGKLSVVAESVEPFDGGIEIMLHGQFDGSVMTGDGSYADYAFVHDAENLWHIDIVPTRSTGEFGIRRMYAGHQTGWWASPTANTTITTGRDYTLTKEDGKNFSYKFNAGSTYHFTLRGNRYDGFTLSVREFPALYAVGKFNGWNPGDATAMTLEGEFYTLAYTGRADENDIKFSTTKSSDWNTFNNNAVTFQGKFGQNENGEDKHYSVYTNSKYSQAIGWDPFNHRIDGAVEGREYLICIKYDPANSAGNYMIVYDLDAIAPAVGNVALLSTLEADIVNERHAGHHAAAPAVYDRINSFSTTLSLPAVDGLTYSFQGSELPAGTYTVGGYNALEASQLAITAGVPGMSRELTVDLPVYEGVDGVSAFPGITHVGNGTTMLFYGDASPYDNKTSVYDYAINYTFELDRTESSERAAAYIGYDISIGGRSHAAPEGREHHFGGYVAPADENFFTLDENGTETTVFAGLDGYSYGAGNWARLAAEAARMPIHIYDFTHGTDKPTVSARFNVIYPILSRIELAPVAEAAAAARRAPRAAVSAADIVAHNPADPTAENPYAAFGDVQPADQTVDDLTTTGIENVSAAGSDAPAEYYSLQGLRLARPTAGSICIVRRGSSVSKVLIR